jgi:hypothetical protein
MGHAKKNKSRELTAVNSTATRVSVVAGVLAVLSPREGVLVRAILGGGRFGVRRTIAGIGVLGLEASELDTETSVEGGG